MIETPVSRVAGQDRPLHGRGSAPARQQRGVHVEDLVLGEQRLLDQRAIRAQQQDVRLGRRDPRTRLRRADVLGLEELQAELGGDVGDRRLSEPPPATRPAVAGRVTTSAGACGVAASRAQHACRELRGAEIDGAHWRPRRAASGRGVLALAQRPHRLAALVARRAVQDQYAVEVVHLVLDDARLQARGLDSIPSPFPSCARTRTWTGRSTSTSTPGRLRQPSSKTSCPWSSTRSAG